ncbi:MAG: iron-sulfur cluster assembly scaffold protein [Deltaproteobacteria bacterium]|nr:MAG: iron-sulfur cluster assembly scaffold protein [Deltaproteobacteria bacterium]
MSSLENNLNSQDHETPDLKQLYSPGDIDHWQNPRNLGRLTRADGHAGGPGPCGDSIWMWIKVSGNKNHEVIDQATFISDVCIGAVSCGSALTEMITGMEVQQAMQITAEMLREKLGGLPEREHHCADLAIKTLKDTIRDYHEKRAAGWKQLYQQS